MNKKRIIFAADFETTTKEEDCRVYSAGCMEVGNEDSFWYTNNIDDFVRYLSVTDTLVYFHNLKFDGEFLINWLFEQGFRHTQEKNPSPYTFTTLIDDMGNFYSMEIFFRDTSMRILDSLKIIPMSIGKMPKAFGLDIEKLSDNYDYYKDREEGHELTEDEIKYLKHDITILSRSLEYMFSHNMTKMTTASNALAHYKTTLSKSEWKANFPKPSLEQDKFIRKSYKGGYTYLNPIYKEKDIQDVIVLDVNSLYPSVMRYEMLPYGKPKKFEGRYEEDKEYPLYIQKFKCNFLLKEGKLPTIQIKNSGRFVPTQYLESSEDEQVELTLTSVDLNLFLEHYEVYDIEWLGGYKYKERNTQFIEYVDYWNNIKTQATKDENEGLRTISKLMLNSLYGKFATNPEGNIKIPILNEEGLVKYRVVEGNEREPLYIPTATFITSYARKKTIETAQKIRDYSLDKYGVDKYVYSDTDSVHTTLSLEELEELIEIDETKLGAWKFEGKFNYSRYLRAKTYIQTQDKKELKITCAGMPKSCYKEVTWENFRTGAEYSGKLQSKRVKGGMILQETSFSIK